MIPYVEIIDGKTLKKLTQVEPQECWFELGYYEVGQFEVYATATAKNLAALQKGRFIKIPNKRFIWYITAIKYMFTAAGARMISATGYEAKWLLNKRIILKPKELQGTLTSAVYGLVNANIGTAASYIRGLYKDEAHTEPAFTVDTNEILIDISGTQAPRGNLLEFVNNLLKTYNCGSQVIYENETLKYTIINGSVKTGSVKFSQSLDNLLSSEYLTDDEEKATQILVVSTFDETKTEEVNGEVVETKYKKDYEKIVDTGAEGIDRAEVFLSSNLNTKYEDTNGLEKELNLANANDLATYQLWQAQEGINELTNHRTLTEVKGELDIINSNYEFDKDFFIGDLVRVQDDYFNYYFDTRILKFRFKQLKVYGQEAEYGE